MQGKRVRKAVWAQVGRISSRGSYQRMALGNGTTNTVWGRTIEVGAPKRAPTSIVLYLVTAFERAVYCL